MASRRTRPLSANFAVSSSNTRRSGSASGGSSTTSITNRPPIIAASTATGLGKRPNTAGSGKLGLPLCSGRSTASQDSGDELSVTGSGVGTASKGRKHQRSGSGRAPSTQWRRSDSASDDHGGNKRVEKKSAGRGTISNSKAWIIPTDSPPIAKMFHEDETPRSDFSKTTFSLPSRPSIDDFLFDTEEDFPPNSRKSAVVPSLQCEPDFALKLGGIKSKWETSTPSTCIANQNRMESGTNDTFSPYNNTLPDDFLETNKTDDYLIGLREKAATLIQRWYRQCRACRIRNSAGTAAMKRLMVNKKEEMQTRISAERHQEQSRHDLEMNTRKRREDKERLARQAAIDELQNKREDKRKRNKEVAEREVAFLQASGKISRQKSQIKAKSKTRKANSVTSAADESDDTRSITSLRNDKLARPSTGSSVGRKVDEIFESSSVDRSIKSDSIAVETARTDDTLIRKAESDTKDSKATFDDLMSALKELEEEPPELTKPKMQLQKAWGSDDHDDERKNYLSSGQLKQLDAQGDLSLSTNLLSADKLRSIMYFLDEVEKAEEDVRSEVSKSRELITSGRFSTLFEGSSPEKDVSPMDSASQVATEISNAISAQKMELDERSKTVGMLHKAMKQQRDFTQLHSEEVSKEHKQQLSLQRQEYEGTIQRHLSFIDQLIDDKKVLSQRCEEVVNKLKDTDQKYSSKIKQMDENHAIELKKQKEIAEAAEKLRREKWIQEKTKQIKEMTVKGLEPDIQRLIAKHKAEIKKLKAMKQGELLESDERVGRRYIQQMEEMREQLEREKDMAVQRERDIARQRYEKQLQQEEEAYQQQRRRLYAEIQEEKERLSQQAQNVRHETLEEKQAYEESQRQTIHTMQEEHRKTLEDSERRHTSEISNTKEQTEIEKQQWIENYMKKQETYLLAKERELKDEVRDARDKEIEMVISRLEQETAKAREECERAADNRIKRIREKYDSEIKELERSERSMRDRYNDTKERVNDIENESIRLRSLLKQKEQENEDVRKLTDQLQEERGKVTDIVRQEFADRLVATEEHNKRLRNDMSEMKARHRFEIDKITQAKEEEMEEVHKRVKQAISRKEETTQLLRQQMQAAEKRAEHLEMLLTEQRKKILGSK